MATNIAERTLKGETKLVRVRVFQSNEPQSGNPLAVLVGRFDDGRQTADDVFGSFDGLNQVVLLSTQNDIPSMRIYTRTTELPFSGQPVLGALHILRTSNRRMIVATGAGEVLGKVQDGLDWLAARAEWSPAMLLDQLRTPAEIERLAGAPPGVGYYYPWAWIDEPAGTIRARMFAPGLGIVEGQASGAAVVRLAAELKRDITVRQGRDSVLHARHDNDGFIWLGGRCSIEPD
jgi:predicted PhzF superfamily epimerase YddE/YHI9